MDQSQVIGCWRQNQIRKPEHEGNAGVNDGVKFSLNMKLKELYFNKKFSQQHFNFGAITPAILYFPIPVSRRQFDRFWIYVVGGAG